MRQAQFGEEPGEAGPQIRFALVGEAASGDMEWRKPLAAEPSEALEGRIPASGTAFGLVQGLWL